jgi:hypothetical protein
VSDKRQTGRETERERKRQRERQREKEDRLKSKPVRPEHGRSAGRPGPVPAVAATEQEKERMSQRKEK